jgi:putative hydroxymethylpyrimidine transport system permease protein
MDAPSWRVLLLVRVPAALPGLGSGLRVAAAWAPIGAVIGEWVGASSGLGTIMLNANARVRTDVMFAALAVLSAMTIAIWWSMDRAVHRLLSWEAPGDTG